jgi:hypothetical protein
LKSVQHLALCEEELGQIKKEEEKVKFELQENKILQNTVNLNLKQAGEEKMS